MLRIRLSRTGKKNHPHYAIVVTEKTNPASDGNFVEKLGYYAPIGDKPTISFEKDRILYWISVGAQPTETVARLLKKEGVVEMEKFVDWKKKYNKKPKKAPAEEEKAAPEAGEESEKVKEPESDLSSEAGESNQGGAKEEKVKEEKAKSEDKPEEASTEEVKEEAPEVEESKVEPKDEAKEESPSEEEDPKAEEKEEAKS